MSGKSSEDHALFADSECISDCSDFTEISEKSVTNSQIIALNGGTKQYAIYFYYSMDALAVCASCIIILVGVQFGQMYAIRKHVILMMQ